MDLRMSAVTIDAIAPSVNLGSSNSLVSQKFEFTKTVSTESFHQIVETDDSASVWFQ
jgi:hypothetical protein